jgi:hypothetical protein
MGVNKVEGRAYGGHEFGVIANSLVEVAQEADMFGIFPAPVDISVEVGDKLRAGVRQLDTSEAK